MSTTIIFDTDIQGHHLEYMHHLYDGALKYENEKFIFVIPYAFEQVKDQFSWKEANHISFDLLTETELSSCRNSNLFKASYYKSKLLKQKVEKHTATNVFLIMLMQFLPFIVFFHPKKVKISGIIYRIYLYEWKQLSVLKKVQDVLKYYFLTYCSFFDTLFILNDTSATAYLNRIYKTKKFKFLPDPIVAIEPEKITDFRSEYKISNDQIMILHFGGLTERKGTMEIMKAISLLTIEQRKKFVFIFAGKIYKDIKDDFYQKHEELKDSVSIIVFDKFISYEFINSLCYSTDYIIAPYYNTAQSSGVMGYAIHYSKPIIVPKDGLLGKLARRYHLSYCLDYNKCNSIKKTLVDIPMENIDENKGFFESNNIDSFISSVFVYIRPNDRTEFV